jgi:hypothetical protein
MILQLPLIIISSSSSASTNIPQLRKHKIYYMFSLNILVRFFVIRLPARLKTRSEGANIAGIAI